jgi:ABC-type multidrug transport system fused ATPase/permease subunit
MSSTVPPRCRTATHMVERQATTKKAAMVSVIRDTFALLSPHQRMAFLRIQCWVIASAAVEVAGVVSIAPLMAAMSADGRVARGEGLLGRLYDVTGAASLGQFRLYVACGVLALTCFGTLLSSLALWRLATFSENLGASLASRLFAHYLSRDWLFHVRHNSAQLIQLIAIESMRVTTGIIRPLMQANARGLVAIFILAGMLVYDPLVSVASLIFFSSLYVGLYVTVRVKTHHNGRRISDYSTRRFQVMDESIGGIRELKLRGSHGVHLERFEAGSFGMGRARAQNEALSQLPRYVMELSAVVAMVGLLLYLTNVEGRVMSDILPTLALFGVASLKLNPALNQIYAAVVTIGGNRSALESLRDDARYVAPRPVAPEQLVDPIPLRHSIHLRGVTLSYAPPSDTVREPVLKALDITVHAGSVVGLAGASGAGKSTVLDVMIGLISPDHGEVVVDGVVIDADNVRRWQSSITCVSQTVFLADATIAENIAFGVRYSSIDHARLREAIRIAALEELIDTLPEGGATVVGQNGVRLSGGQRQRIGIARALYREHADVIVLDEATSALDVSTERTVLERIRAARPHQTVVIVTHRLWTLEVCDVIHVLGAGQVRETGAYHELLSSSQDFRLMTETR